MTVIDDAPIATAELVRCADPECGRPFLAGEGWDGRCDPCAAQQAEHLAGAHASFDGECRYCR